MTMKIKWRLSKLPTTEEIAVLVKDGLLTKDEAREILFNQEDEIGRDKESLQEEIKFLRELVQKLSVDRTQIIKTIEYIQPHYTQYPWYQHYRWYCDSGSTQVMGTQSASLSANATTSNYQNFNSIQTF